MSNLSRHRNKLIAGAVIATAGGLSAVSSASPLVNVQMMGWDISTQGPAPATVTGWQSTATVHAGDTVVYEILTFLSPVGTTNHITDATHPTGHTITATVSGTDGINSLSFDAYQLSTDQIQVDLKNGVATQTTPASHKVIPGQGVSLNNSGNGVGWNNGQGSGGGHLGHETTVTNARAGANNDILFIRPVQLGGTFRGITSTQPASLIGTGLFVVSSIGDGSSTPIRMRYTPSTEGGKGGGFAINGQTDIPNLFDSVTGQPNQGELGNDPFVGYNTLNIVAAPEPGSLSLLGLAAAGLLARRKNKKA